VKPEENASEPSFWEALGITPIVIDNSTPETFAASMDQVDAALLEAINDLLENGESNG
jgi:phosphoketolase